MARAKGIAEENPGGRLTTKTSQYALPSISIAWCINGRQAEASVGCSKSLIGGLFTGWPNQDHILPSTDLVSFFELRATRALWRASHCPALLRRAKNTSDHPLVSPPSDSGSASIHREIRALDKAGAFCREEDNGFGNLVGCGWTPRWCLRG